MLPRICIRHIADVQGLGVVINSFRGLERLPNVKELHHWADYAELNCLAGPDHLYSPTQLVAQLRRGRDNGEATDASTQGDAILDTQTMDALLGIDDDDEGIIIGGSMGEPAWDADLNEGGAELTGGPLADSFTRRVDDIWRHLRYRTAA